MTTFADPRMQVFASIFQKTQFLIPLVLDDLSEEEARRRSRGEEGPSIAWIVGHMLGYRGRALKLLGVEWDDPWGETFVEGGATDGAEYPSLAELKESWNGLHDQLEAVLMRTEAAALDKALPAPGGHGEESVLDKLAFTAWHEAYHMGALGALRKALGRLGPAERVRESMEASAAP